MTIVNKLSRLLASLGDSFMTIVNKLSRLLESLVESFMTIVNKLSRLLENLIEIFMIVANKLARPTCFFVTDFFNINLLPRKMKRYQENSYHKLFANAVPGVYISWNVESQHDKDFGDCRGWPGSALAFPCKRLKKCTK